jgi:hypothetical protein
MQVMTFSVLCSAGYSEISIFAFCSQAFSRCKNFSFGDGCVENLSFYSLPRECGKWSSPTLCRHGRVGFLGSTRILILPTGKLPSLRNPQPPTASFVIAAQHSGRNYPSEICEGSSMKEFFDFHSSLSGKSTRISPTHRKYLHFLNFLHACKTSHSQVSFIQLCTPNMTESASGDVTGN